MIYFIHNETARTIKIGCAWNPRQRLSTLQISTSNKLVLLGSFAGTKKIEKEVHGLVYRHCGKLPGERPLHISGEWFDDRILPFVTELMAAPENFLEQQPKKPPRARPADRELRHCGLVLVADSGDTFREPFILKAATSEAAMAALTTVANARLAFLAHTMRITQLVVPGCTKAVSLRGTFVTAKCNPREGASVILNSERRNGFATLEGVKQYADRWLHGVPSEFYSDETNWWFLGRVYIRATRPFYEHLDRFARTLEQANCVIKPQLPLVARGLYPRGIGRLPKGELRSKVNQKVAGKRRQRAVTAQPKDGIVYFIQDGETIKIGFCLKNPKKRLAELQVGNSNTLRLLGHAPGSETHEARLHRHLSRYRIQGEWFTNAILADVHEILKCASLEEWLKPRDPPNPASAPVAPAGPGTPT